MIFIGIKDAYLFVPVARSDRQFLRFRWKEMLYEFQCLPFGLSSAPRVFTRLLKPIIALTEVGAYVASSFWMIYW